MSAYDALDWDAVRVGAALPTLTIEVTATVIAAGAIATRDFMPVHHDRDYANQQGAPDIFMNILSTNAHCSRFLTDWAGPEAIIKNLSIRLGVPMFPRSTLTFDGTVTATSPSGDEGLVEVAFRGVNELGDHVTGTATLSLPRQDQPFPDIPPGGPAGGGEEEPTAWGTK